MAEIKRLHYFDHQFLVEADFTDEQAYHLDMRRRHNRVLHTYGVADGLQVKKTGSKEVTVETGTAVDREGREMVLDADHIIDLSTPFAANDDIYVTIAYTEQETDEQTTSSLTDNTRVTETALVEAVNVLPNTDGSVILLGNFTLDGSGNVPGNNNDTFDAGLRQFGGASIPNESIGEDQLADGGVSESKLANNAVSTRTIENGAVTGDKIAPDAINASKIANLSISAADLANNSISENKLNTATRGKLVTNGNNHDHSGGDGAQIRHSTLSMDDGRNPHGTRASDVSALPITGGTISGSMEVSGGPLRAVRGQLKADPTVPALTASNAFGYVVPSSPMAAGIWASTDSDYGLFIHHYNASNYAIWVNSGLVRFPSGKSGYVVDLCVNGSKDKLQTGDIVKLKDSPIARFEGDFNKIPVPVVTLADKEGDGTVIGIVDREAPPGPSDPDLRTEPDDPTWIDKGGDLMIVTLGAYAHCKVDASEAPIQIGDLLTSSSNPGHAQKATEPKIGTIIGKALESLESGTGYIAVFVNIQ